MTARAKIIKQIIQKIDKIPDEQLENVLSYVQKIEKLDDRKKKILSFAGAWKNMDQELFDDLTINLHDNRRKESKTISE